MLGEAVPSGVLGRIASTPPPDAADRRVVSPILVGRAAELDLIARAVAAPPAVVVVDGEAGIGKTRLVNELLARPEVAGRRPLVGRCQRIRESFPLGPVIEAVRGLGGMFPRAGWSPVVGALRPLLPELAELLPPAPMPLADRAAERHRVFRALAEVLGSLGPAVLVLEDLHWADEQTADFISYLLPRADGALSTVLTWRGEEIEARIRSATVNLPPAIHRTEVALRPLSAPETGALAAAIVGAEQVSAEFAGYLCERSSGLPFAIEELLALLRARGKLVRRDGGWARRALDELDVPAGIRYPVLERFGQLPADARSVAEAAAVLQVPVPVDTLVATCRVAPQRALPAIEEALESGLLVEREAAVVFRHVLAAQAVYEQIPGPRRRDLHGRAAATLGRTEPVPLGQVAHHLLQAGRMADWVDAAVRAADQAGGLGHDAETFRLLEEVLRRAPLDPDRRGRLAVQLGRAAIETFRVREVLDLLSGVLDQDLPAGTRGELRFQLGLLLHEIGEDPVRVRQLLTDAVADLPDRPDLQARAMVVLGMPATVDVPLAEHRRWLQRALGLIPAIGDPLTEVFLLGKVAMVMAPLGDPVWRTVAEQVEARTGGAPTSRPEVNAYWSVGAQACYAGHHLTGDRLLRAGLAGAIAGENPRLELSIRSGLAMLRYCRGGWDGLGEEVDLLVDALAEHPRAGIDVETIAGCLALVRGDLDAAGTKLARAVADCRELGGFDVLPLATAALVRLELGRGEPDSALATATEWIAMVEAKGVWAPDARALPAVTEALVAAGEIGRARALVAGWAEQLGGLDAPLAPAALGFARGLLAGEPQHAAREFAGAADRYLALGCPYEAALATERAAARLFAAGEGGAAEAALRKALSAFRDLPAEWDAARAVSTARRHGVSVPARHRGGRRGYGAQLSPREREVAELAATGRSNKEIAAELFLSVNTVARHVSAAMRKLDARSRAGLAHQLSERSG